MNLTIRTVVVQLVLICIKNDPKQATELEFKVLHIFYARTDAEGIHKIVFNIFIMFYYNVMVFKI